MYESFYGMCKKPFQMVPDPKFLYKGERYKSALTYLEYGLSERVGFILLTGDIGTGKTTLIKYLLSNLSQEISPAVIFNTNVNDDELVRLILLEYELIPTSSKAENVNILYDFLMDQYGKGKRPLLIIDEAQNLELSALEEVRMLFNLQAEDQLLLQIVLVGQTNLRDKLLEPCLDQMRQRIGVRFHLSPLSKDETSAYIKARLEKACGDNDIFSSEAIDLVFEKSEGVPRIINSLCDAALVQGYAEDITYISLDIIEEVSSDDLGYGLWMPAFHDQNKMTSIDKTNRDLVSSHWSQNEIKSGKKEERAGQISEAEVKIDEFDSKLQHHENGLVHTEVTQKTEGSAELKEQASKDNNFHGKEKQHVEKEFLIHEKNTDESVGEKSVIETVSQQNEAQQLVEGVLENRHPKENERNNKEVGGEKSLEINNALEEQISIDQVKLNKKVAPENTTELQAKKPKTILKTQEDSEENGTEKSNNIKQKAIALKRTLAVREKRGNGSSDDTSSRKGKNGVSMSWFNTKSLLGKNRKNLGKN